MNFGQRELRALIEKIAIELRDPIDNYVHQKQVVDAVEEKLRSGKVHPAILSEIARLASSSQVSGFFASRKPKLTTQGSLYFPGFWLPLGGGKRVQMCDATDLDLVTYGEGVEDNRKKVDDAAKRSQQYIAERVLGIQANPGRRLHWVEVNVFGYAQTEQDPNEYLSEASDGWDE